MREIKAFITGMKEFRESFTTAYNDYGVQLAYEQGREFAHRVTLRRFEV